MLMKTKFLYRVLILALLLALVLGFTTPGLASPGQATADAATRGRPIRIFMILKGSRGPICGDSVFGHGTTLKTSGSDAADIKAALKALLAIKSTNYAGLYNPLARSQIRVSRVDVKGNLANVYLRGTYVKPKDPCDNTRVREQVWATVKQFPGITATNIYLNNMPFGDKLSNGK
jgi:hypothetical protein